MMIRRSHLVLSLLLLVLPAGRPLLAAQTGDAGGDDVHGQGDHNQHMQHQKGGRSVDALNVSLDVRDVELLTGNGERVRFSSDVLADKLVAITFTFTSCTTICPIYGALFRKVQDRLGDRLGDEVVLVTLTLDPARDVPARMKREAERFGARPGWYHLTGEKQSVDEVLRGLDAYFADFTLHPPMALVGDAAAGIWRRFNGFPPPADLVAAIDELTAARNAAGGN